MSRFVFIFMILTFFAGASCKFNLLGLNESQFQQALGSVDEKTELLYKIVQGASFSSYKVAASEGFSEIEHYISNLTRPRLLTFEEDTFKAKAAFSVSKNKMLKIEIKYFGAKNKYDEIFEVGIKTPGLNRTMLNFFASIFSGINLFLEKNPSTRKVKITGSNVINESLAKILERLGFRNDYSKRHKNKSIALYTIIFFSGISTIYNSLGYYNGLYPTEMLLPSLLSVFTFGSVLYDIRKTDLPREWILELDFQKIK